MKRLRHAVRGRKFGRLTPIAREKAPAGVRDKAKRYWHCSCECGKEKTVLEDNLKSGHTKSCGCLVKENKGRPPTDSLRWVHVGEYNVWGSMRKRCTNPRAKGYKDYGGRGIEVCPRWDYFKNFLEDMGPRPGPGSEWTLGRADSDGDYCPENCSWQSWHKQARNNSRNKWFTYRGKEYVAADLAEKLGLSRGQLYDAARKGWSGDEVAARLKPFKRRDP